MNEYQNSISTLMAKMLTKESYSGSFFVKEIRK